MTTTTSGTRRSPVRWVRGLAAGCALIGTLAGCELFSEEEILEGDRVRIRADRAVAPTPLSVAPGATTPLPPQQTNSDWSQTNATATHVAGHLSGPASLSAVWTADAGAGGEAGQITSAPIVVDGTVYTLDARAAVSAIDAGTGRVKWRVDLVPEGENGADGFGGGLAFTTGTLIATTGFGEVVGLSPDDGARLWTHTERAPFRAPPAADSGLIVAVTRENKAVGLRSSDGALRWSVTGVPGEAGYLGGASPAIGGPLAVLPFSSGEIVAVSRSSGQRAWSAVLGGPRRGQARSAIADVTGDPIMAGRIVVAGNQAGRMVAIDAQTGRRGWTRSIGASGPVWAAGTSIYVTSDRASLLRMDIRTGRTEWEVALPAFEDPEDREDPIAYSGPVLVGGQILLTSSIGEVLAFRPDSGQEAARIDLAGGTTGGVVVAGGTVYVLSGNGTLTAYR